MLPCWTVCPLLLTGSYCPRTRNRMKRMSSSQPLHPCHWPQYQLRTLVMAGLLQKTPLQTEAKACSFSAARPLGRAGGYRGRLGLYQFDSHLCSCPHSEKVWLTRILWGLFSPLQWADLNTKGSRSLWNTVASFHS